MKMAAQDGIAQDSMQLRIARPVFVALLAMLIIAITAQAGIKRGMDHKVMYGPEYEQRFISVALSDSVYHLNLGYVAFRSVNDKLTAIWNRGAKTGAQDTILIENSSNGDLINDAIRAAASLGPQTIGHLSDGSLVTTVDEDLGEVDYYKLAFRLFGQRIQSYYYLFFTLLALSSLVFIAAFHDDIYALTTLLFTLFAFFIELHLNLFSPDMPTFPGQRHGSTLALIPLWYFAFSVGRRASLAAVCGALIQVFILILAWRIRGSVSWVFVFLFALTVAVAVGRGLLRPRATRSLLAFLAGAPKWPVYVLLFGVAANFLYNRAELNPIYSTDDVMSYHGPWHSAYLGLLYEPQMLGPKVQDAIKKYGGGDMVGFIAGLDYADRIHFLAWDGSFNNLPPGWVSPWTGEPRFRLHEDLMRGALFEAIARAPLKALMLYLWKKPRAILAVLKEVFFGATGLSWLWYLLGGGVGGAFILFAFGRKFDARTATTLLVTSAATVAFAALPNIWAYAATHVIADLVLTLVIFAQLALSLAVVAAVHFGSKHLRSKHLEPKLVHKPAANVEAESG